jgi:hypothetical protein
MHSIGDCLVHASSASLIATGQLLPAVIARSQPEPLPVTPSG